jgi:tetratricopeptide (TPR) repeat protein
VGAALFVGRVRELERLRTALDASMAGAGRLVLLSGEPGIGKTRLAERIAAEAAQRGARILVGRCYEGEGAPAYWPWVMALRDLAEGVDPERVRAWLGRDRDVFGRVVPELVPGAESVAPPQETDAESARFRFFDAVANLLRRAAIDHPVVLLLDDLHWADGASLRLLSFAASQIARSRVLLVATFRDVEMRLGAESSLRAQLARAGETLGLSGLGASEVADVVRSMLGAEPRAGLAVQIHDATAGNPFFVDAVVRVLAAAPASLEASGDRLAELRIPEGVLDAVRERMRPLSPDVLSLLAVAASIGREFSPSILARVAGVDAESATAALEKAEALGLVQPAGDGARWRFAHALIVETLLHGLGAIERARIHLRIADVLAPMVESGGASIDEVASHCFAAVPAGAAEQAVAWADRAADRALKRLGYEDAVRYYRRAVEILDAGATGDPARRVDLLLALAEAERRVGDAAAACAAFARAGALADDAGLPEALARAALGYGAGLGGVWDQGGGTVDPERVRLVEAALAAIGPEPSGLRAMLLAHYAASLFWSGSLERRAKVEALGREALEMADRVADPAVALAVRASVHFVCSTPDDAEGRLADAREIVRRAIAQDQPEVLLRGRMYAAAHHLELGDIAAADAEVDRFDGLADELRQPRQRWYTHVYRGMRAYLSGRFDEVERIAAEGMVLGERAVPLGARLAFGAQLTMVRHEQGRAAEMIGATRDVARAAAGMPVWTCALALALVEAGDHEAARLEIERLAADGFASVPRDFLWTYAMTLLSRSSAALGDVQHAATLYGLLAPYEGRISVAQHGILCDGAVDRYLGLLAATLGRFDEASRHFADALARNERIGARIFVTATQRDHAAMLLRRGAKEDVERARDLLVRAAAGARELGQEAVLASVAALQKREPKASPARLAEDVCTLRRSGGDWTVDHAGRTFPLRHTVGMGYLLALLRQPGREVHTLDLVTGDDASGRAAGDAGELLDEAARAAYRRRLAELAQELEEARGFHDIGRAERAQAEIDSLTEELSRAVGLGGRPRRAGSDTERARLNVTRAVRRAIEAIAERDAVLGSDLDRGIRTGVFCCYDPDPRLPIRWEI